MQAFIEDCCRMLSKFGAVRNTGDSEEKTTKIRIRPNSVPRSRIPIGNLNLFAASWLVISLDIAVSYPARCWYLLLYWFFMKGIRLVGIWLVLSKYSELVIRNRQFQHRVFRDPVTIEFSGDRPLAHNQYAIGQTNQLGHFG